MEDKFKLGSEELKEELAGQFAKFALNIPQNIEVLNEDVQKRVVEYEKEGKKILSDKYDLHIKFEGVNKIWSVSKKVLTTINEHIGSTDKFKVILRESQYEVIPLGLKE